MTNEQEQREAAIRPVTVRQCDIDRLKRKTARVRQKREEWKKRALAAEELIQNAVGEWWRRRYQESETARSALLSKLDALQGEIASMKEKAIK